LRYMYRLDPLDMDKFAGTDRETAETGVRDAHATVLTDEDTSSVRKLMRHGQLTRAKERRRRQSRGCGARYAMSGSGYS